MLPFFSISCWRISILPNFMFYLLPVTTLYLLLDVTISGGPGTNKSGDWERLSSRNTWWNWRYKDYWKLCFSKLTFLACICLWFQVSQCFFSFFLFFYVFYLISCNHYDEGQSASLDLCFGITFVSLYSFNLFLRCIQY